MAYGKGSTKDLLKRMADLGQVPMTHDLGELRAKCLETIQIMADMTFTEHVTDPIPTGRDLDATLLPAQSKASKRGLNNVYAEKCRMIAKATVAEQMKRRSRNLFGKFKHVAARGNKPMADGALRLINLPEEWSRTLTPVDIARLDTLAKSLDFRGAIDLFQSLRSGNAGLSPAQAEAMRAMMAMVQERFKCPLWSDDAVIQLHLDYRCVRGGAAALTTALDGMSAGIAGARPADATLALTSHIQRGPAILISMRLQQAVANRYSDRTDQSVSSVAIELGPEVVAIKGVITRPPVPQDVVGANTVVGEDFGFVNTSTLTVVRSNTPITSTRVEFATSKPGKEKTQNFLEENISGDDVEVLEQIQLSGRNFLGRIKAQAERVDVLRREIDLIYSRMDRIRDEINRMTGDAQGALITKEPVTLSSSNSEQDRYGRMHAKFFRLLNAVGRLKALRRGVYASVAGLKKAWFGHVANTKARLAEKYGAVVAREDLTILAIPKDDPAYKGRTFNRMINNGAKGQYIRRADNTLKWRGIPQIVLPSYYSSSTDWRIGLVDKKQRRGEVFTGRDGTKRDADMHASETLARWLFLRPKETGVSAPV